MVRCRSLALPLIFTLAGMTSGCTEKARNDVAASAFIKAVNLKCKITKAEAKLAWDLADDLGADEQARQAAASAGNATDKLLADIDRLDGPVEVADRFKQALASSKSVLADVSNGQVTAVEGRAKLEDLRRQAQEQGFGECVSA